MPGFATRHGGSPHSGALITTFNCVITAPQRKKRGKKENKQKSCGLVERSVVEITLTGLRYLANRRTEQRFLMLCRTGERYNSHEQWRAVRQTVEQGSVTEHTVEQLLNTQSNSY